MEAVLISFSVHGKGRSAPEEGLLSDARLKRPLRALHQPAGSELALLPASRRVHCRALHLRTSKGGRLRAQGLLREAGRLGVSQSQGRGDCVCVWE